MASLTPNSNLAPDYQTRQEITYTHFNKVETITANEHFLELTYGLDQQRISQKLYEINRSNKRFILEKQFIAGVVEKVIFADQTTKTINYITSPEGIAAIEITANPGGREWYWVFTDHLGSITTLLRESDGQKFEMSFDAWGNRRAPAIWMNYTTTFPDVVIDRGFTGHEHLDVFGLINMNGRVYDPVVARFLSPDPYIQAPGMPQNYNGYVYCWNNPLVYTDPDGEIIFTILSAIFCPVLLPMAIQTDIGWITGGLSSKANGGTFWEGALVGGAIGAINGGLSMISPLKIPFGESGFGLGIAPQFAVGTDGIGIGVNATVGYDLGKGFNVGVNLGGTYYASTAGTGASGFEGRIGYGIGYEGEHFQAGIGSTYFFSGETSQLTGQMYAGGGKWKLTYENDTWAPVPGLLSPGGAERDRFRTAALRFDITGGRLKGANAGFNIFTGESDGRRNPDGSFRETSQRYRLGALYVGYGNARIGYNSEKSIRGPIQNGFHNLMNYPHFEVLNISDRFYGGYYSSNPYTLW